MPCSPPPFAVPTNPMSSFVISASRRGRPRAETTPVHVRAPADQLAAIDAFIAASRGKLSRPDAYRTIAQEWLRERGLIPSQHIAEPGAAAVAGYWEGQQAEHAERTREEHGRRRRNGG